jgi:hypothetical protein
MLCFALSACFFIAGRSPSFEQILDAVQFQRVESMDQARAIVIPAAAAKGVDTAKLLARVSAGALLVTEGDSPLARALGLTFDGKPVQITQIEDTTYPKIPIIWEKAVTVVAPAVPPGAKVLAKDKWSSAPLAILFAHGQGRVLFIATELDGYARYPYFMHWLIRDCGLTPPFRSARLHAFFDYGYRTGVDLDYFAARWRKQGVMALHISAWQFWDRDRDEYLKNLIEACHRQGVLVYAWFELPHVSDKFWQQHEGWREKTAALVDAHLDWRALVNLLDPAAFAAVSEGMSKLLADFDWDGLNLSELYFESPQGPENEQRFTPMNDLVRAEFRKEAGIDPVELFRKDSPNYFKKDTETWKRFINYRVSLVERLHVRLFAQIAEVRRKKPYLHTVVTFVDNLYEERMREALGADVRRIRPLMAQNPFTLIIEDPATMWGLGPDRYRVLGDRYRNLASGVDINVVDRYQDVFPTKKQTGGEFLELFHNAAESFANVLLYFEASAHLQDLDTVAYALAAGGRATGRHEIESPRAVMVNAKALRVDGVDSPSTIVPAGKHTVEQAAAVPEFRLLDFNGQLLSASYEGPRIIHFRYRSDARVIPLFSMQPRWLQFDGVKTLSALLPPGEHEVRAFLDAP